MANQDFGRIITIYQGKYNPTTEYEFLDEVKYGGALYRHFSRVKSTGSTPTDPTYWVKVIDPHEIGVLENPNLGNLGVDRSGNYRLEGTIVNIPTGASSNAYISVLFDNAVKFITYYDLGNNKVFTSLSGNTWTESGTYATSNHEVTIPTISGNNTTLSNNTVNLTASGGLTSYPSAAISGYEWILPDASNVLSTSISYLVTGNVGDVLIFKCRSVDTLGNSSAFVDFTLTIVDNQAPDISGLFINAPTTLESLNSESISISGTEFDPEGDSIHYELRNLVNLTASKLTNLNLNEVITITAGEVLTNTVGSFNVYAVDSKSAEVLVGNYAITLTASNTNGGGNVVLI